MGFGESDFCNSGFGELKFGKMEFGDLEGHPQSLGVKIHLLQ